MKSNPNPQSTSNLANTQTNSNIDKILSANIEKGDTASGDRRRKARLSQGGAVASAAAVTMLLLLGAKHDNSSDSPQSTVTAPNLQEVGKSVGQAPIVIFRDGQIDYASVERSMEGCDPQIDVCVSVEEEQPGADESGSIQVLGSVAIAPKSGEGYRAAVLAEADQSEVAISEEQLDTLVEIAKGMNLGENGAVQQPIMGVNVYVPNILGPVGTDLTPAPSIEQS